MKQLLKLLMLLGIYRGTSDLRIDNALNVFNKAKQEVQNAIELGSIETQELNDKYFEYTREAKQCEKERNVILNKLDRLERVSAKLEEFTI